MTTELVTVSPDEAIGGALERVERHGFSMYPVVDELGVLRGVVSGTRLRRRVHDGRAAARVATEAREEAYLKSDMALVDAMAEMSALAVRQMAVVDVESRRLVGVLAMSDMLRAHTHAAEGRPSIEHAPGLASARPALKLKRRDSSQAFQHPTREPEDIPPR